MLTAETTRGERVPSTARLFLGTVLPLLAGGFLLEQLVTRVAWPQLSRDDPFLAALLGLALGLAAAALALYLAARRVLAAAARRGAEAERVASIPRANPNPIIELARDGRVAWANLAAEAVEAGRLVPADREAVFAALDAGQGEVEREVDLGGRTFAVLARRARDRDSLVLYCHDVTERRRAELALRRRVEYERALAEGANLLYAGGDPDCAVQGLLERLLEVSVVSRVYLFENFRDGQDGLCCRQVAEACAPGVAPQIGAPELRHVPYEPAFRRWARLLGHGQPVLGAVAEFPPEERGFLEPQEIKSMLVLPLFLDGRWHGFVGFDETRRERSWEEADVRLLSTAVVMLEGFLERHTADAALREAAGLHTQLLATTGEGYWLVDERGRVLEVNDAWCRMTGWRREDLIGRHVREYDVGMDDEAFAAFLRRLAGRGYDRFRTRQRLRDGGELAVEASVTALPGTGRHIVFLRESGHDGAAR